MLDAAFPAFELIRPMSDVEGEAEAIFRDWLFWV
jgi:hypothetical protein